MRLPTELHTWTKPSKVTHSCHPSPWELEAGGLKSKIILGSTVSLRKGWVIRDLLLKQPNNPVEDWAVAGCLASIHEALD